MNSASSAPSSSVGGASVPMDGVGVLTQLPQSQRQSVIAAASHGHNLATLAVLDIDGQGQRSLPFSSRRTDPNVTLAHQQQIHASPTAIQTIGRHHLAVGTQDGSIALYGIDFQQNDVFDNQQQLQGHTEPVTALSVFPAHDRLCSTSEDGLLHIWDVTRAAAINKRGRPVPLRCSMLSCATQSHREVVVGTNVGAVEVWDTSEARSGDKAALTLTSEPSDDGSLQMFHSVAVHPSESNVVVAGGHDGVLVFWDTRQPLIPLATVQAHAGPVWQIAFASRSPHHLFTASEDGSVLHWNTNPKQAATRTAFSVSTEERELVVEDMAKHTTGAVSGVVVFDECLAYARYRHEVAALTLPPLT